MTTSADQGSIAEVGSPVLVTPAPVDAAGPWRWMTSVIAIAALVLLVLNAPTLDEWLGELTPNRVTQTLRPFTAGWAQRTRTLAQPHARLHDGWQHVRDWRFGDEQPGERGAAAGD